MYNTVLKILFLSCTYYIIYLCYKDPTISQTYDAQKGYLQNRIPYGPKRCAGCAHCCGLDPSRDSVDLLDLSGGSSNSSTALHATAHRRMRSPQLTLHRLLE